MNAQTQMQCRETAQELAERLADAYSTDNYRGGWIGCVKMLRRRGYDDRQVEAIIRSKWTRWAHDASNKPYGRTTSADLARFMDKTIARAPRGLMAEVQALTAETFGS